LKAATLGLCWLLLPAAVGCMEESPLLPLSDAARTIGPSFEFDLFASNPGEPATLPDDAETLRRDLLAAINAERHRNDLMPLRASATLELIAEYHTTRMVDGNFFAHVDPYDRSTIAVRAAKFNYAFVKIGENLGAGQMSVDLVMKDWLGSPAHRANLFDPEFNEVGIAVIDGGRYGRYWTLEFGRPLLP
jgi:uncharacterized protein YkwD